MNDKQLSARDKQRKRGSAKAGTHRGRLKRRTVTVENKEYLVVKKINETDQYKHCRDRSIR